MKIGVQTGPGGDGACNAGSEFKGQKQGKWSIQMCTDNVYVCVMCEIIEKEISNDKKSYQITYKI